MPEVSSKYDYKNPEPTWANHYLWPIVKEVVDDRLDEGARVFDVGCGSGATSAMLAKRGFEVVGIDPSSTGIELAREAYPGVTFAQRSAYDDLAAEFGTFDAVVSLEVVEHCFDPRAYARTVFALLKPGGFALVSTPYHGYLKNLALAITNKFDRHWDPLWDGGHIKFWSEATLRKLLEEVGFTDVTYRRAGRFHLLAKSMIAIAERPERA